MGLWIWGFLVSYKKLKWIGRCEWMTHNNKNTIRKEQPMMNATMTCRMDPRYMDPRYMDPRILYDVSMLPPMPPILVPLVMPVREENKNKRKWSEVVVAGRKAETGRKAEETERKAAETERRAEETERKELLEAEARGRRMADGATEYDDEEVVFLTSMMRGKMNWADMCDSSDEE